MKRHRDTEIAGAGSAAAVHDIHETDDDNSVGDEDMTHFEAEEDENCGEAERDGDHCEDAAIDEENKHHVLAKFLCYNGLNPNFAESQDFRDLVTILSPSFASKFDPDKTKNDCLKIFEEAKVKAKHTLNNRDKMISLSVDVLTNYDNPGHSDFICLSAHFIDDNWKFRNWVLRYQRFNRWTSDFIDAVILKSLDEWNLKDKVYFLTSRNIDVCDEVVDSIKSVLKEKKRLPLDSHLFSVSCCAEMFGFMAEDAFQSIADIIYKLKMLQCSRSVASMWHLTHSKLKTSLRMESLGEYERENIGDSYDVPCADEWEEVRIVYRLVDYAYNVAKKVFETEHPTANKFFYSLLELRESLITETTSSDPFPGSVAEKMLQRLDNYLKETFLVLAVASVMDIRCKMQYIENISTKFENIDGFLPSSAILEAIQSIYADYLSRGVERENLEGTSNVKMEKGNLENDNREVKKSDLDSYLEEPILPWDNENFNVLQWWKSEAPKYPNVSKMAREYLAIPISVATGYDAYYYLENRPPDYQVINLESETMNEMMCFSSWNGDLE